MGLLLSTTRIVFLLCATFRAPTTFIIILLRSLADPGGAFDAPKVKCPPDRGSSDWVTDSPAPTYATSKHSSNSPSPITYSLLTPHVPQGAPQPIPYSRISSQSNLDASTPPLTPDDGEDDSEFGSPNIGLSHPSQQPKDALDFLLTIFPRQGLSALPYARRVSITAPTVGVTFEGVVLDIPGKAKTFYVEGKSAESVSLRESIVALLDLADGKLECSALIIVLERSSGNLASVLHSLMYVGGTVVTKPIFEVDPAFVLVGLDV